MTPFREAWIPPTPKRDPLWKRIAHFQVLDKEHDEAIRAFGLPVFLVAFFGSLIYGKELRDDMLSSQAKSIAVQTAANHFRSSRVFVQCERHNTRLPWECYAGSPSPASGVASKIEMVCTPTSCTITSKPAN